MKHLFDKQNKYSIRKLSIGVCSAVIGLSFLSAGTAYAEENASAPSVNDPVPAQNGSTQAVEATLTAETAVLTATDTEPVAEVQAEPVKAPVLVETAATEATTSVADKAPTNAVDSNLNTFWQSNPSGSTEEQALIVRLEETATVDKVSYRPGVPANNQGHLPGLMTIGRVDYSNDGSEWTAVDVTRLHDTNNGSSNNHHEIYEDKSFKIGANNSTREIFFTPVQAQYLRLVGIQSWMSRTNGSDRTGTFTVSEFKVNAYKEVNGLDAVQVDPNLTRATTHNEGEQATASKATDGNPNTYWASSPNVDNRQEDQRQQLVIGLQEVAYVDKVLYTPRQYLGANGNITKGYIEYSVTGEGNDWHRVTHLEATADNQVELSRSMNSRYLKFQPVLAKYLRLTATAADNIFVPGDAGKIVAAAEFSTVGRKVVEGTETYTVEREEVQTNRYHASHRVEDATAREGVRRNGKVFLTQAGKQTGQAVAGLEIPTGLTLASGSDVREAVAGRVYVGTHAPVINEIRVERDSEISDELVRNSLPNLPEGVVIKTIGEKPATTTVGDQAAVRVTLTYPGPDNTNPQDAVVEVPVHVTERTSVPQPEVPNYPPVEEVTDYIKPASAIGRITDLTFENGKASITYETGHKAQLNFYNDHVFRYNVEKADAEFVDQPALVHANRPAVIALKTQADYQKAYGNDVGRLVNQDSRYILETKKVLVIFDKATSRMSIYDRVKGEYVTKEVDPVSITASKSTQTLRQTTDEQFFGGGMQNGRFTHKGEKINIVNENNWIDGSVASPNPFYWSSKGYGVLRNTFKPGLYDFGTDKKDVMTSTHNEERFDAFYFVSSRPADILKDYYELTGAPAVLPEYALYLGHLNAYNRDFWVEVPQGTSGAVRFEDGKYYKEYQPNQLPAADRERAIKETLNGEGASKPFSARAVIERYQERNLPLAWFLPNDGYGAGYGQASTLDGNIENLRQFVAWAKEKNIEVGLWTQADLESTNGDVVTHRDINKEVGVAGIRAIKTDVAWVGPGYNFGLNGVDEGAKRLTEQSGEDKARPFIVSLDGWAGTQRSAAIWSGDQRGGEWEYIRFHIPTYIGMGLSGNPNMGSDMDGIFGGGNAIINARDYQWKAFTSILMNMDGWGREPKTPFSFDDKTTDINRMSLKLKSTLVPYAYSTGHDSSISGKPIVRAMLIDFPDQPIAYTKAVQYQYMYGDSFLVAPIYKDTAMQTNGDDIRNNIFLPAGAEWLDLYTGKKYEGGQVLNGYEAPLWKIPVFVKNGAIIPMANANNNPGEIDRTNRLITFYPHNTSEFKLFEDDGKSVGYKSNELATTVIKSVAGNSNETGRAILTIERTEGDFKGFVKEKKTELHVNVSKDVQAVKVEVNGQPVELRRVNTLEEYQAGTNVFFYHNDPKLETYNPTSAEIRSLDVTMNDLLKIKLAAHDVTQNAIKVTIEGFSNAKATETVSENIELPAVPTGLATPSATIGARAIKTTWSAVEGATSYDVDHNGVVYTNIKATEFNFDSLTPGSEHSFKVRSVNAKGHSDWSVVVNATTNNDPWAEAIDIDPANVTTNIRQQGGQAISHLFDKKKGNIFHSRWGESVSPGSYIRVDLGGVYELDQLEYHQRNDGGVNGRVIWANFWVSEDGTNWESAGTADWRSSSTSVGKHTLDKRARYVHMEVTQSQNGFISGEEMLIFKKPGTRMFVPGDISNDGNITEDDKTSFLNYTGLRREDSDFGGYVERVDSNKNGIIDALDISIAAVQLDGGVTNRSTVAPSGNLRFEAEKLNVKEGEAVKVYLIADDLAAVNALTATFQTNIEDFELVGNGVEPETGFTKQVENFSKVRTRGNELDAVFSFVNFGQKELLSGSGRVAYVTLRAKRDATLAFNSKDNLIVGNDLRHANIDNQPVSTLINYTQVPAVPTTVVAERPTHGSVTLTWDAVPQAVRYIVERETTTGQFAEVGRINTTNFNVYNLSPETTYKFRVRATNPLGQSEPSEAIAVSTVAKDVTKKLAVVNKVASVPEQPNEPLGRFFDNDESTIYHSQWGKSDAVPSKLTLDLGEVKALDRLIYVPRPAASNGTITGLTVETSLDGDTWIPTGEVIRWERNALDKIALFPVGTEARHIRINWLSSVGGFVSGQELYVIESAAQEQPDTGGDQGGGTDTGNTGGDQGGGTDTGNTGGNQGGGTDTGNTGGDQGGGTDTGNTGGDQGSDTDTGNTGGDQGGGTDTGNTGGDQGGGTDTGNTGGDQGGGTDTGNTGGDQGSDTDTGNTGGDQGSDTDTGNTGGDQGGGTDTGNTGGDQGGSTDTGNTGGDQGGGTDTGNTGGDQGGGTDTGNTGGDQGGGTDTGNTGGDQGGGTDTGNTGGDQGGGTDTGNTGGDQGGGTDTTPKPVVADQATGVKVEIVNSTDPEVAAKIAGASVAHKETGNQATPSILQGKDYDIFDIELVDKDGNVLEWTGEAKVTLPIDAGKEVAEVIYLPNSEQAEKLDFEVSEGMVTFTAKHFSEYGIVYKTTSATQPVDTPPSGQPQQPDTTVDIAGLRNELLASIDASDLSAEQKGDLAVQAAFADTASALTAVQATFTGLLAEHVSTLRNDLLKAIDVSGLTDAQKGELAVKASFAETAAELKALRAELSKVAGTTNKPAEAKPTATKKDEKTLPATGEADSAIAVLGTVALISALGLAGVRKRQN